MREVAADCATVADLRMRDVRQCFRNKRQISCRRRIALQVPIACQGANVQAFRLGSPGSRELRQGIDIDQNRRLGQPKIHGRDETLAAGEKTRLLAIFGLQRQGLLERASGNVPEWRGFHAAGATIKISGCGLAQSMERTPGTSQNNMHSGRQEATDPAILMIWHAQYSLSVGKYWARDSSPRLPIFFCEPSHCTIFAEGRPKPGIRPGACKALACG